MLDTRTQILPPALCEQPADVREKIEAPCATAALTEAFVERAIATAWLPGGAAERKFGTIVDDRFMALAKAVDALR